MCCDWQSIGAGCYKALVEKLLTKSLTDMVGAMPRPLRCCNWVWWPWLCQHTRWKVWLLHMMVMGTEMGCHRSITEDDVYPESGRQSSGWSRSAVVFANKWDDLSYVLNSNNCAENAITDQLLNHGIPACLQWSHTKNPHMTIYKIWALTYIFWGDKKFYGDKDKFLGNKK